MDNIYWNPSEYEYEEPLRNTFSKEFVDPWDLENYVYLKQHLEAADFSSEGSSFGDSATDKIPPPPIPVRSRVRKTMSQPTYPTGINSARRESENRFVNRIPKRSRETEDIYGVVDFDTESELEDSSFGETIVSTKDNSFTFLGNKRTLPNEYPHVHPVRERSFSYSFGDYDYERYSPINEVYSRLSDMAADPDRTVPIYDDIRQTKPHFRLGKCGHLQIDYSWSWNNLDKYIYN